MALKKCTYRGLTFFQLEYTGRTCRIILKIQKKNVSVSVCMVFDKDLKIHQINLNLIPKKLIIHSSNKLYFINTPKNHKKSSEIHQRKNSFKRRRK